ncbi:MAG: HlyD family secretion protein [Xanthobacteraceae bacterium]
MTRHSPTLEIESPVPARTVLQDLLLVPAADKGSPGEAARVPAPTKNNSFRKLLLVGAALVALAGASGYGWEYWAVGQYLVSTDDAYVKADTTTIAPKVSGYLREVRVGDNESVKAGQVLARIDERDYAVALDQAKADVAAAQAALAAKQAQSRIAGAQATIERDTANLSSALKQPDLLKAEIAQATAALARASAVQSQAELNLGYTTIVAPIDGVVGNRSLRVGQFVQAGTQLMSVVPVDSAYVVANFKETQLTNVRQGQPVEIAVDMFPGQVVHGRVDSIAPASGQEFAPLPPDNAAGHFTKVVQRIPVKITFRHDIASRLALRPGMSVVPSVNTFPSGPTRRADAAATLSTPTSLGSRHVQSSPVSIGIRAADLWRYI